jgi:transcriptional regulator with XRE-family HTH domain
MTNVELREFLRARRSRVRPEDVGLARTSPHRRVPGLRREELAQLAGVSADYYARLEQGRPISPSDTVLSAIARALCLDAVEQQHLFNLVRVPASANDVPARTVQQVRPEMYRLLDSLGELQPALILGRRTDVLAINKLGRVLIADYPAMPAAERNKTRWIILDPAARDLFSDWEQVAGDVVGCLRREVGRHPGDPRTAALVNELSCKSEHFRRCWESQHVMERSHGTLRMRHPLVGAITIHYEAMNLPADPDQQLFLYHACDDHSREALRKLAGWDAQPIGSADSSAP